MELLRFIDDSIEDGEELDEVLDSTRELMQLFGSVQAISVAHHDTERVMLITFLNGDDALRARDAMHNSVYGGIKVEANLVKTPVEGANIDTDKTLAAVFPDRKVLSRAVSADRARVIPGLNSDERRLYDNHSILNIINFVFPKDIEDEDEAQDVLNDTLMLCEKFSPAAVWLENHDSESIVLLHTDENNIEADGCPLGILVFKSLTEAAICRDYICSSSNLSAFLINANLPDINFLNVSQMFGATIDDAKICEPATSLIKMNDNFCLKIGHFVDKDEIMDEVERCDIVSEIRSLCERKLVERLRGMGLSMTMSIPTIDCVLFGQFISDELLERSAGSFPLDDTTAMLDVYVIINATKQSLLDVVHLLYALSGVLVGGLLLDMSICCINSNVLSGMISSFDIRNGAGSIQALDGCLVGFEHSDIHVLNETTASQQSTVAVLGLPWQVNGAFSSIETSAMSNSQLLQHALWRFEWKMSLLSSCGYPGTSALLSLVLNDDHDQINKSVQSAAPPNFFNNLWYVTITSINPLHCTAQVKNLKYLIHSKEAKAKSLEVCVAFASVHHATAALLYLENLTIGGSNISVCVKFGSFYCPKQNTDSVSRTFDASVSSLSSGLSATARVFEPKSSLVKPAPAEVSVEIIPPAEKARVTADVSAASATVISAPPRLPRRTTGIIGVKVVFMNPLKMFSKHIFISAPLLNWMW